MNKFLKEIKEQPQALKETLNYYAEGKKKESLFQVVA